MRTTVYRGEIWEGSAVAPQLWQLLLEKDLLIELSTGAPPYHVILGAPHHAGPGVDRIADHWISPRNHQLGRAADEATGLAGLAVLHALAEAGISARLVISAHALYNDPNKTPASAYWRNVFNSSTPRKAAADRVKPLLFELHGASKTRYHDLELSAGRNHLSSPHEFGAELAAALPPQWVFVAQTHPGSKTGRFFHQGHSVARLENPALGTNSLTYAAELGMPALHLEMKPFLRLPAENSSAAPRLTPETWILAQAVARTIGHFLLPGLV